MKKDAKVPTAMKLSRPLVERLDRFKDGLPYPTTRTALVETAIEQMLDREEQKPRKR